MKKWFAVILCLCMVMAMTGCARSEHDNAITSFANDILDSTYTVFNDFCGELWSLIVIPCDAAELTPEQAAEVAARNAMLYAVAESVQDAADEVQDAALEVKDVADEEVDLATREPEPPTDWGDDYIVHLTPDDFTDEEPAPPSESDSDLVLMQSAENIIEVEEETVPMSPAVVFTDVDEYYYISTSSLNFREGPDISFEKITSLSLNTKVHVIGKGDNGWDKIDLDGKICYADSNYLSKEKVVIQPVSTKESLQEEMSRRGNIGRLVMDSCGVDVALFSADLWNLSNSQAIVDRHDSAAYYPGSVGYWGYVLVADHNHQGFSGIKKAVVRSTTATFDFGSYQQTIVCVENFIGYNGWNGVGGLYTTSGEEIGDRGDVCMYTCNSNGTVTITFWNYI